MVNNRAQFNAKRTLFIALLYLNGNESHSIVSSRFFRSRSPRCALARFSSNPFFPPLSGFALVVSSARARPPSPPSLDAATPEHGDKKTQGKGRAGQMSRAMPADVEEQMQRATAPGGGTVLLPFRACHMPLLPGIRLCLVALNFISNNLIILRYMSIIDLAFVHIIRQLII